MAFRDAEFAVVAGDLGELEVLGNFFEGVATQVDGAPFDGEQPLLKCDQSATLRAEAGLDNGESQVEVIEAPMDIAQHPQRQLLQRPLEGLQQTRRNGR